jgi:hypothetical protein
MTSACIEDSNSHPCKCTAKPSVGNGVLGHDAESHLPRMFRGDFKPTARAKTDPVDRLHVKSAGIRCLAISEGYRYVTWYRLFFLVTISIILTMVGFVGDSDKGFGNIISITSRECFEILNYLGTFIIQAVTMRRMNSGVVASLALSSCGVVGAAKVGNERVENQTFDIFDYIDPLIGTINGGEFIASILKYLLTMRTGHVFPGATLPFGEHTALVFATSC